MSDIPKINIITSKDKEKPLFKWEGKPSIFKTVYEEDKWWDTQRARWYSGYGGLTGRHYFTVTQGTYKTATNVLITPDVRDGDITVFEEYEYAKRMFLDYFIAKRRGFALSSIFGSAIPMYEALTNPGSTNLITSADKKRLEELHKDKLLVFYSNLDPDIKPSTVSSRQTGYLHFGYDDGSGGIGGLNSKIISIQTSDKPADASNFEAYRGTSAFIDEVFLHPRPDEVVASAQASMMAGLRKVNPIVLGGSAGIASAQGSIRMQEYWLDASNNDVHTLFVPGTLCITEAPEYDEDGNATGRILNFCPNGRSDEKRAMEYILRTRERLDRAKSKKKLNQFIKAYPLTIEELFDINTQSIFTEDINDIINEASIRIRSEQRPVTRWDLKRRPTGIIEPVLNQTSGEFHILEHPQKEVKYGAGNDPIPFGHEEGESDSNRSKNAVLIGEVFSKKPVAFHVERTHDADAAMMNALLLMDYYGVEELMVERNRGQMLIDSFKRNGYSLRLSREPAYLNPAKKTKPLGWYKDAVSAQTAAGELVKFIKNDIDQLHLKPLIDEIKKFMIDNTDLLDAFISFLLQSRGVREAIEKSSLHNKVKRTVSYVTTRAGRRVIEKKTIYLDTETGKATSISRPDVFNHGR
jgi:hypothetical protein